MSSRIGDAAGTSGSNGVVVWRRRPLIPSYHLRIEKRLRGIASRGRLDVGRGRFSSVRTLRAWPWRSQLSPWTTVGCS